MQNKKLYRSTTDRVLFGVCAGIGEFFGIDPTVVRLVFVLGTLLGFGSFFFLYLIMWLIVPEAPGGMVRTTSGSATVYDSPVEPPSQEPPVV